ncbi:MAG: class I SAM-dependent methyltransferase [Rhodobacteraceae bacterium]|nr:class I SAM-dependent methyltransferase [Paracoccaceae bacterium]
MLIVPGELNRNAQSVKEKGAPADTGATLIRYMCHRIGIESLAQHDVLDYGCGVRFSEAIVNRGLPVGSYTGVEVKKSIVDFLTAGVSDPRFRYIHTTTANQFYNSGGDPLSLDQPSPIGPVDFDIICMFSVITHQNPVEARPIFDMLRRQIRPGGHLFFSAFEHDKPDVPFMELEPAKPGLKCSYSRPAMTQLLDATGWRILTIEDPRPGGIPIMTSFLCAPV